MFGHTLRAYDDVVNVDLQVWHSFEKNYSPFVGRFLERSSDGMELLGTGRNRTCT